MITLAGSSDLEVSGGVHVAAGPGHINLIEDTTGKGHIARLRPRGSHGSPFRWPKAW